MTIIHHIHGAISRFRGAWLTIIHIYTVLFLGFTEGLSDNYPYIHGAISRFRGGCLTIIHIYTVLFLDLEGWMTIIHIYTVLFLGSVALADNYPHIHGAIPRFRGVV